MEMSIALHLVPRSNQDDNTCFGLTSAVDIERTVLVDPQLEEPLYRRTAARFGIEEKLVLKCVCLHHHSTCFGSIIKLINAQDIRGDVCY